MLTIDAQNDEIVLKNIERHQLKEVLDWYNMSEEYGYATGKDGPVSLDILVGKYKKIIESENDFFLGVHYLYDNKLVGIMSGRLSGKLLWISLLAIACEYRCRGFGSMSVKLLMGYIKQKRLASKVYLTVAEKNIQGRNFWFKNGFFDLRRIEDHTMFDGSKYNVIVMEQRI